MFLPHTLTLSTRRVSRAVGWLNLKLKGLSSSPISPTSWLCY